MGSSAAPARTHFRRPRRSELAQRRRRCRHDPRLRHRRARHRSATTHIAGTFNITGGAASGATRSAACEAVRVEASDGSDEITLEPRRQAGWTTPSWAATRSARLAATGSTVDTGGAAVDLHRGSGERRRLRRRRHDDADQRQLRRDRGAHHRRRGGGVINGTNGTDAITVIARDASHDAAPTACRTSPPSVNDRPEDPVPDIATLTVNALGGSDDDRPAHAGAEQRRMGRGCRDRRRPAVRRSDRLVVETPGAAADTRSTRRRPRTLGRWTSPVSARPTLHDRHGGTALRRRG